MTLSTPTLTRTLWLRQQLVPGQRTVADVPAMVSHLIGLQAQDNLPPYLSLAARIDGFSPADLSDLIEDRTLVRFFTMRGTVHVLTADDALRLRGWVQPALDRQSGTNQTSRPARDVSTAELDAVVRPFLAEGPRPLPEIGAALGAAHPGIPEEALRHVTRERLPLLQVPPRGLWKRSGGVVYQYADRYLGRPFTEVDVEELVLRYLAAYGPATAADMTQWSLVTHLGPVFTAMAKAGRLTTYANEKGRTLYDVPGAPIAPEDLPLPPTLLGMYDNVFLSHADRDRIAPDEARRGWMGANGGVGNALFLEGLLSGVWRLEDGKVVTTLFRDPTAAEKRGLASEIERVETFLALP